MKRQATLPIVADYVKLAQDSKYFIARERCEFVSRLLNNNVTATRSTSKLNYDIKKLGKRKRGQVLLSAKTNASSSHITKKTPLPQSPLSEHSRSSSPQRSRSSSPECSRSSSFEHSQSSLSNNKEKGNLIKNQEKQQLSKATTRKVAPTSYSPKIPSSNPTDTAATKNSTRKKPKSCNSRSALVDRSTPILDRLRTKRTGRNAVVASLSSGVSSNVVLNTTKSKNKNTENDKKHSHSSENEKDNECTPVLSL